MDDCQFGPIRYDDIVHKNFVVSITDTEMRRINESLGLTVSEVELCV